MANSKYEYVKQFEQHNVLLRNTWVVVRLDGHAFHRFTKDHVFEKPNSSKGLELMNECAMHVMQEMHDIVLAYGQSDEYSFVFRRDSQLYKRRESKWVSLIASLFTAQYIMKWKDYFPNVSLRYPPSFDARAVCYPSLENIRDYLSWRQADCHINNLYNTCFWTLVLKGGRTEKEAEAELCGTVSGDKNELLFSKFGMNYNNIDAIFRKGSTIVRKQSQVVSIKEGKEIVRTRKILTVIHEDIIGDHFWLDNPNIL